MSTSAAPAAPTATRSTADILFGMMARLTDAVAQLIESMAGMQPQVVTLIQASQDSNAATEALVATLEEGTKKKA